METLFYIVCFFPFINWLGIGGNSDIQPYCMIITLLLLIYYSIKRKIVVNRSIMGFYVLIIIGLFMGVVMTLIWDGLALSRSVRYLATYISLILVSCFTYLLCRENGGLEESKIKKIINIYLIVGIIQLFYKNFLYGFIANPRTTGNRGVISLTSEPSFYGYMCIFFLILALDFKKNRNIYIINLLFQICILAKSSITMLYIAIFMFLVILFSVKKMNMKSFMLILGIIFIGVIIGYYYITNNSEQRITFFINTLLSQKSIGDIINRLLRDYSVAVRANDIKVCLVGFAEMFGVPYGFDTRKISSGYGSLILTMGWIGVIIVSCIFRYCKMSYNGLLKKVLPIFLTIIMFSAIQVANPVFQFLIGYFMFLSERSKLTEENESR